jgi:hypothetical protein
MTLLFIVYTVLGWLSWRSSPLRDSSLFMKGYIEKQGKSFDAWVEAYRTLPTAG